jgi:hypothetical protein
MTTHTAAAVLLATAAVLGACSSGDEAAPESTTTVEMPATTTQPATTPPTTTSTSPTTTLTAATTTAPTTQPPVTTTPATAPPSTVPPMNTLVTPEQIAEAQEADRLMAEAVTRDWTEGTRLGIEALFDPSDQAALDRALAYTTDGWTEYTAQFVRSFRDQGQRVLPDPVREPTLTVETTPLAVPFTSDEVTIITCEIDPWVLVDAQGNVISDRVSAYRDEVRLRLENGIWKTAAEVSLQQWIGGDQCVGAPQ